MNPGQGDSTKPDPVHEFRCQRRIEFADTDMAGIAHFARFFVFMESAEHQFHSTLGSSIIMKIDGKEIGWPRLAASCEFLSPVRFGDLMDIRLRILRKGRSSMTYAFDFKVADRMIARGKMSSACCELDPEKGLRAMPIPRVFAERVRESPDQ